MNLLSSLEKYGFSADTELDITKDHRHPEPEKKKKKKPAEKKLEEKDYLVKRHITCPVCDHKFDNLSVRGSLTRRLEPDFDLRPRYENIDTLKYDITLCPRCGYAAMSRFFEPLTNAQIGRLTAQVQAKFHSLPEDEKESYTYREAIDRYKLALVSAMVKYAKISEKSMICLRIAWLIRDEIKEMTENLPDEMQSVKDSAKQEMDGFYRQAYEGFVQAVSKETPPFCGMNSNTIMFLITNMAMYFRDYKVASKYIYDMIGSKSTSARMKARYVELKDQLLAQKRKESEGQA